MIINKFTNLWLKGIRTCMTVMYHLSLSIQQKNSIWFSFQIIINPCDYCLKMYGTYKCKVIYRFPKNYTTVNNVLFFLSRKLGYIALQCMYMYWVGWTFFVHITSWYHNRSLTWLHYYLLQQQPYVFTWEARAVCLKEILILIEIR